MGFFQTVTDKVKEHFEKKQLEHEEFLRMKRESDNLQRIEFERGFRKESLNLVRLRTQKEVTRLTGWRKIRALEKLERLREAESRPDSVKKFMEFTARNKEKTERNLALTKVKREMIQKMKQEKLAKVRDFTARRERHGIGFARY